MIRPFLTYLDYPEVLEIRVPRAQKARFSKKEKIKYPQVFTQSTSVPNFSMIA